MDWDLMMMPDDSFRRSTPFDEFAMRLAGDRTWGVAPLPQEDCNTTYPMRYVITPLIIMVILLIEEADIITISL